MPVDQSITTPEGHSVPPNPPHESIEKRITRVRDGLEVIFGELEIVLDVCITVHKALVEQNVEQDGDFANVLQRCGSDKLHEQLEELNDVIEDIGGKTSFSDDAKIDAEVAVILGGGTEGGDNE